MTETGTRRGWLPPAEVALAGVTLATVACMWRLFTDGGFFLPLAAHAIAAHGLAAALRRRGAAPATSAFVCLLATILALTWGHLWASTTMGFPTGETARQAVDQLDLAWRTFGEVRAPAPVLDGFLLSAGAAIWVGAWLADLAAFRLWTPFEALIPGGTLFVFASLFSADRSRALAGALWLAAAFTFVLLHRTARQQASPAWLGSDPRAGGRALVRVGAGLAAVAVALGWLIGPHLPGAQAEAVVGFGNEDAGGGSRTTISPLVEIRGRLVDQAQVQLFTVEADARAYWRLTSLDIFDGDVWSSRGAFGDAGGDLGGGLVDGVATAEVTQRFTISSLAAIWLPAAFEPDGIEAGDAEVRWDDVSSTLIVGRDAETSDGLAYEVVSQVPGFDPAVLAASGGAVPSEVADRSLSLPDDFPATVRAEAERIVADAGATTAYQQALALQDYFRGGLFTYSLDVPAGHSDSAIEDFLFVTRVGYCEQFAGTYAAMARALGLPARVGVGFTPGDPDPAVPGRFLVRGEHAHAWPEVYLAGVGWVAFEPTPGRGAPGAESYTGVPESQDTAGDSTAPSTVPAELTPTGPTVTEPGATESTVPGGGGGGDTDVPVPAEELPDPASKGLLERSGWFGRLLLAVVAAVVLVAGSAGIVVLLRRRARQRRRLAATTPERRVAVALDEMLEAIAVLGLLRHSWETATELTRRLAAHLGVADLVAFGGIVDRAEFDPAGVAEDDARAAVALVAAVTAAVLARTSPWRRLLAAVDPRSLEGRARARAPRSIGPRILISPSVAES